MAVEVLILSGSRQGERFSTDLHGFQAGGTPQCHVYFDPQNDAGARDRVVGFQLHEDGWKIQCVKGTGVSVNDKCIQGTARLRSGDIVRLSPTGPDFSFRITARLLPSVEVGTKKTAVAISEVASPPGSVIEASAPDISSVSSYWAISAIAAGLAVTCLVAVMSWSIIKTSGASNPGAETPVEIAHSAPKQSDTDKGVSNEPVTQHDGSATPSPDLADATDDPAPSVTDVTPPDPWEACLERLRPSVFLLAVEQPQTSATWPIGSACAIGEHQLLTSASVVTELATFQARQWKLWAINDTGLRAEIKSLRVHVGFTKTVEQPEQRIYFDVGFAGVSTALPSVANLASSDQLRDLSPGFPVACVGVPCPIEMMSRFQENEVQLFKAKAFIVTALPPAPGPRLLHFRANMALKPSGGPIVDEKGQIYATYAESASEPNDPAANLNLHYAPVINPELITLGLAETNSEVWVPPVVPLPADSPSKSKSEQ